MLTSLTQKIALISTLFLSMQLIGCQETVGTESPEPSKEKAEATQSSSNDLDSTLAGDPSIDLDSTLGSDDPMDLDTILAGDDTVNLDSTLDDSVSNNVDTTVVYTVVDMRPEVDNWMTLDSTQLFQKEIWLDPGDRMELKFPGIASDSLVFRVYLENGEEWNVSSLNSYFYSQKDASVGMWLVDLQPLPEEDVYQVIHRIQQDQTVSRPVDLLIRFIDSDFDL